LLSYGHLKFFTLLPENGHRITDNGDRITDTDVILYSVQCCYAEHWADNNTKDDYIEMMTMTMEKRFSPRKKSIVNNQYPLQHYK